MKFKSIKNWNITLIVFGSILLVAILLCILFGGNEIRMMSTNISLALFVWIDAFLIGSLWFMLYQDFYVVEKDYVQINKFILAKKEIAQNASGSAAEISVPFVIKTSLGEKVRIFAMDSNLVPIFEGYDYLID